MPKNPTIAPLDPAEVTRVAKAYFALASAGTWPSLDDVAAEVEATCPSVARAASRGPSAARVVVCRLLKKAKLDGYLTVQVNVPQGEKLAAEIENAYGNGIEIRVVPEGRDYASTRIRRGEAIASYFDELVRQRKQSVETRRLKVAISGGDTLYQAIHALKEEDRPIDIVPAALVSGQTRLDHITPSVLVTLLWAKSGGVLDRGRPNKSLNGATGWQPPIPDYASSSTVVGSRPERAAREPFHGYIANTLNAKLYAEMKNADIVLVSTAPIAKDEEYRKITNHPTVEILNKIGIDSQWRSNHGFFGDVNYCLFGRDAGESVSYQFFIGLSVSDLKELVRKQKRVVLTGGQYATREIHYLLMERACNVLITDEETARAVLELGTAGA